MNAARFAAAAASEVTAAAATRPTVRCLRDPAFWRTTALAAALVALSWLVLPHLDSGPLRVVATVTFWSGIVSLGLSAISAALDGLLALAVWHYQRR